LLTPEQNLSRVTSFRSASARRTQRSQCRRVLRHRCTPLCLYTARLRPPTEPSLPRSGAHRCVRPRAATCPPTGPCKLSADAGLPRAWVHPAFTFAQAFTCAHMSAQTSTYARPRACAHAHSCTRALTCARAACMRVRALFACAVCACENSFFVMSLASACACACACACVYGARACVRGVRACIACAQLRARALRALVRARMLAHART